MDNAICAVTPDVVAQVLQNAQAARRRADEMRIMAREVRGRAARMRERARALRAWRYSMPTRWPADTDARDRCRGHDRGVAKAAQARSLRQIAYSANT